MSHSVVNSKKHGVKAKRRWRKRHLAVDDHHPIVACELTDKSVGDTRAVDKLLNQMDSVDTFIADAESVYESIQHKNADAVIIIPPPKHAVEGNSTIEQRNEHTRFIKKHGR